MHKRHIGVWRLNGGDARNIGKGWWGVEGSTTSSFGEYEFKALSSVETEVIVVGPGVDMIEFGNAGVVIGSGYDYMDAGGGDDSLSLTEYSTMIKE